MPDTDLLRASFTAADGTRGDAYTPEIGPVGADYETTAGTWKIQSGMLTAPTPATGTNTFQWLGVGTTGVMFPTFLFRTNSSNTFQAYLYVNFLSDTNLWFFSFENNRLRLYEITASVATQHGGTITIATTASTTYKVWCAANGDTITGNIIDDSGTVKTVTYTVGSRPNKTATGMMVAFEQSVSALAPSFGNIRVTPADPFAGDIVLDASLGSSPVWQGNYWLSAQAAAAFSVSAASYAGPAFSSLAQAKVYLGALDNTIRNVYCRGGQTALPLWGETVHAWTVFPFGAGNIGWDMTGHFTPNSGAHGMDVLAIQFLGTYSQHFVFRGTYSEEAVAAGGGITIALNDTGKLVRFVNCEFYEMGHAGIKQLGGLPDAGSEAVTCVFRDGGLRTTDHGCYMPEGNFTFKGCAFYNIQGYGVHCYHSPGATGIVTDPIKILACVAWNCGQGGFLTDGNVHQVLHCTVLGTNPIGGIVLYDDSTGTVLKNNYVDVQGSTNADIFCAHVTTTSVVASHNRVDTAGVVGTYSSTGDVTTADAFDTTPSVLTDCRRIGGLNDGVNLGGADSSYLLDPASNWPRLIPVFGTPPIGAFANPPAAINTKLTDLSNLAVVASGDMLYVVDISDTTDDPAGSSRNATVQAITDYAVGVMTDGPSISDSRPTVSHTIGANQFAYLAGMPLILDSGVILTLASGAILRVSP